MGVGSTEEGSGADQSRAEPADLSTFFTETKGRSLEQIETDLQAGSARA